MTSATGTLIKTKGFTLVEVMVTIAIIAVMAITVTFVVPDQQNDALDDSAEDLYQRIRYAQEYALLRHAILGLRLDERGYTFVQWQDKKWQPLDYRGLRAQEWPEGVVYEIDSETEALLGQDEDAVEAFFAPPEDARVSAEEREAQQPQLWILGSGDISVFKLRLQPLNNLAGYGWLISSDDGYQVTLQSLREAAANSAEAS
ncbi:pilus assembly FimT family protein [Pseudidiomarina insulisalsae]|uniref:Type II secretion system protein H n=1 Tax=Pseudidiomarina insulisalsae TaxID=575789 RepID=A0A432YP01_9GAMM|nr:GspH/FimT family pseudopilin [Pseudidiomarina insulisalsae]RUO62585.1 type II secretion system protein GspH [Pseudidiomarina insulisalsae]